MASPPIAPSASPAPLPRQFARPALSLTVDDRPIAVVPLGQIASLIAPPLCAACGSSRQAGDTLCERCEAELKAIAPVREPGPAGVDLAVSAAPFEGVARGVVHGLKFGRRLSLADVAAKAMLGALPANELGPGLAVVPVPAGPWRW